jgi:hypothetical protein
MGLHMRTLYTKTHVRLANGQRAVASTKVCDISFTFAQHNFVLRTFHVLRDLCVLSTLCWAYHGWMVSKRRLSLVPSYLLH